MKLLGVEVVARRAVSGGHTDADRGVAVLADGRECFYKRGTDPLTAQWLRDEWDVYGRVEAPFLPRVYDWVDGEVPLLVLEALPAERFPPPWTPERLAAARSALAQIAETPAPSGLSRVIDDPTAFRGWAEVADDPAPLLGIGFADPGWLEAHLFRIQEAEASLERDGDALLHQDFRSDNFCVADRPVVVDWNWACIGNPDLDVAFWLPSLTLEGGPQPWEVLPQRPDLAAAISGFFASREAVPGIPEPVRRFQRAQLRIATRWLARELRIPVPRLP